jgi:hydroxymethylglutaryl-CoA lyase/(R)-citramalyl-CoA lyase
MAIDICEVGPRDGLQNHAVALEPSVRAELVDRLAATGLHRIEAVSFVNPKAVPRMAGAAQVIAMASPADGTILAALVLNRRGLDDALAAGVGAIHVAYPLTETFCQKNQNMTLEQAATGAGELVGAARVAGLPARAILGAAFGCPFEGAVDPGLVIEHVRLMAQAGADEILLADTIGVGVPTQVARLVPGAQAAAPGIPIGLHLHNTRNTGYANAVAGIEHGVSILDASIGGLGGCPFAPRATGNIATEDLVYLLDGMGIETGVSLEGLIDVAEWLAVTMGTELPGLVHRAGPFALR